MASTTSSHVPWRYRFTLFTIIFSLQTKDRIDAVRSWADFSDWRQQFVQLQTGADFLPSFPSEQQRSFKRNAALVVEQFNVWEVRAPWRQWVSWPIYLVLPPVLVSAAFWVIGEPVFALRSHAYYLLLVLMVLKCASSRYATATLFKRLHRDSWATLLVQTGLGCLAAFVPGCRFLYRQWWYTLINIAGTCCLVHWIQYSALLKDRRQDKARERDPGPGVGDDEHILSCLDAIEPGWQHYQTGFSGYWCNFVHNTQDVLVREAVDTIIKLLKAGLSPNARDARYSQEVEDTPVVAPATRVIKRLFTVGYVLLAFVTIGTLIFQWGSFAQAFIALYAVGMMLLLMMISDHYSLEAFLNFYNPKMAFLLWSLPHVNFLLIGNPTRFTDNPLLFWVTYAALMVENLFLTDLVVYYAKRFLLKAYGGSGVG